MKKVPNTSKNIIALFLAVALINIYVTDFYCSFTKEAGSHHSEVSIAESAENHHSHDVNEAEIPEENHLDTDKPETNHNNDRKDTDNCCKDNSAAFFSSLVNHSLKFPVLKTSVIAIVNFFQLSNELFSSNSFSIKGFSFREYPPPKTPDVRIFLQSFII